MIIETAEIKVSAEFSDNKTLRFLLKKTWNSKKPTALFILLNPSKADVVRVDNTFCNIINQSVDLGYGEVKLVNLYPFMTTEPKELKGNLDLGKDENLEIVNREINSVKDVFIAWGTEHNRYKNRKSEFESMLNNSNVNVYCWFDKNSSFPKHLRIVGKDWNLNKYNFVFIKNK